MSFESPRQDSDRLEELLYRTRAWLTAKEIVCFSCGSVNEREIRSHASESSEIISGQKGYKHVACATPDEISHAANWLESQAKKMSERACAIRRRAHQLVG